VHVKIWKKHKTFYFLFRKKSVVKKLIWRPQVVGNLVGGLKGPQQGKLRRFFVGDPLRWELGVRVFFSWGGGVPGLREGGGQLRKKKPFSRGPTPAGVVWAGGGGGMGVWVSFGGGPSAAGPGGGRPVGKGAAQPRNEGVGERASGKRFGAGEVTGGLPPTSKRVQTGLRGGGGGERCLGDVAPPTCLKAGVNVRPRPQKFVLFR